MENVQVIVIEPNGDKKFTVIENTLKAYQDIVGGNIEVVKMGDGNLIICNEEGAINGMPYTASLGHINLFGNLIIVSEDDFK